MYWQGKLPLPSSVHSEPSVAGRRKLTYSVQPGSWKRHSTLPLATGLGICKFCYPDSYSLHHKCPRLKSQIKI